MNELRYTLICDGSSDVVLLPLLTWLLREHHVECAIQSEWADLRRLPNPPRRLADKIRLSVDLFPCDLLFIHRDAERELHEVRVTEIQKAVAEAVKLISVPPQVCVVPVRMQEAWLLFDEAALRRAGAIRTANNLFNFHLWLNWNNCLIPKMIFTNYYVKPAGFMGAGEKSFQLRWDLAG